MLGPPSSCRHNMALFAERPAAKPATPSTATSWQYPVCRTLAQAFLCCCHSTTGCCVCVLPPPPCPWCRNALQKPKKNRAKEANKAAGKASKKRPQPSSSDDDSGDDRAASGAHATTSSPSSSSDGGADAGAALAGARRVKLATHVGRYHKRERAKTVKNYSSQDLAAILGAAPGSSVGVAAVTEEDLALAAVPQWPGARMAEIRARPAESSSEDEEEDGEGEAVPAPGTPVLGEEQPRWAGGGGAGRWYGDGAAADWRLGIQAAWRVGRRAR